MAISRANKQQNKLPETKDKHSTAKNEKPLNVQTISWDELAWVDINSPTEQEIAFLEENYQFHPLDLDDCLSRIQRPKIDQYKDYLFLVFHFPVYNKEARVTSTSQLAVFIGKNYLITIHKGKLKPLVKLFRECQLEEDAREEFFGGGPGYLLYRIVDRLVDYCLPILNKIGSNIEDTEDCIFASQGMPRAIERISSLRRDVIAFRRIIWPMRAVVGSMEPKIRRYTTMDLSAYFGDMTDHIDKIWDGLDEYKEIIEGLNDTHDSLATNRTNDVMRMLTIIATILLPLTTVGAIYGMNIPLPLQDSPFAFVILLIIWMLIAGGMLMFFRRNRWI